YRCILFTLRGPRRGPLAWVLYRFLRWFSTLIARQVFAEDGSIYGAVQRGLEASPHRGVIGTREERIYYFQKYVLEHTRGTAELPVLGEFHGVATGCGTGGGAARHRTCKYLPPSPLGGDPVHSTLNRPTIPAYAPPPDP